MAYEVREIYEHELQGSLDFAKAMYDLQIAHSLEARDRYDFLKSIEVENIHGRLISGSLYLYGGFDNGALVAVAALTPSGNITFFFIENNHQGRGIEIELFELIKQRCTMNFRIAELSADVPQVLIPMYQFLGFQFSGEASSQVFSRFAKMKFRFPIQYSPIPEQGWVQKDRKKQYVLLAVIIAVVVAVLLGLIFVGMRIAEGVSSDYEAIFEPVNPPIEVPENPYNDPKPKIDKERDDNGQTTEYPYAFGSKAKELDFIKEYAAKDIPFSLKLGVYEVLEQSPEGEFSFSIEYPIIEGMENKEIEEKINNSIRNCAMLQKDAMYPVISDSLLNLMDEEYYMFESVVECRVSYLDENVISVAFFDHYFLGSVFAEFADMRTLTYDLRTGEICELYDLLFPGGDVTDQFIDDFRARLLIEDPETRVFTDMDIMSNDALERILLGEVVDNRYFGSYFVTETGLELFITYHYRGNNDGLIARGVITTHYKYNELLPYEKSYDLWDVLPH